MAAVLDDLGGILRPLEVEDLPKIYAIESSVYEDPWSSNLLKESLTAPMTYTLGLFSGTECCGYAVFQVIFSEGHLLNLAVANNLQRNGIGTYILREVLAASKKQGASSMFLEVRHSNARGRRLYEKFGFKPLLSRENYYSNGEAALVMVLDRIV
jgi:ribosomal-protein-alanine N-acetyltransferase